MKKRAAAATNDTDVAIDALAGGNTFAAERAKKLLREGIAQNAHQAVHFALHGVPTQSSYEKRREDALTGNWRDEDWRDKY